MRAGASLKINIEHHGNLIDAGIHDKLREILH